MSKLVVGATVRLQHVTMARGSQATFRIEALLRLDDGIVLYKVKSEAELFDRIVSECEIAPLP